MSEKICFLVFDLEVFVLFRVNPSQTANRRRNFNSHVCVLKKQTTSNPNFWHQPNTNEDKNLKYHVTLRPCFHTSSNTGAQFMISTLLYIHKKPNQTNPQHFSRSEIKLCQHVVHSLPLTLFRYRGLSLKLIYRR